MNYMDKYPIIAWFAYVDEAETYKRIHPNLTIIVYNGGYALINCFQK